MRRLSSGLGCAMLLGTAACGVETTQAPPTSGCRVTAVAVSPAQATVVAGQTTTLAATVSQEHCGVLAVTWRSEVPAIASVSSSGVVTGVAPGSARIEAEAGGVRGSAQVTVEPRPQTMTWTTSRLGEAGVGDPPVGSAFGVWVESAASVYVGTALGGVFRYDGAAWSRLHARPHGVAGLWRAPSGEIVAVGMAGAVSRFDGTTWREENSGTTEPIHGVWGPAAGTQYAVGSGGTILRYTSGRWAPMSSPTTDELFAIDGAGPSLAFAVGDRGTILRFDGTQWSAMASPTSVPLFDVWVGGASLAYAVGTSGTVLRFDGAIWTTVPAPATPFLRGVWGSGANAVYVVGFNGYAARWDGAAWTSLDSRVGRVLWGIHGAGGAAVAVGANAVVELSVAPVRLLSSTPSLTRVFAIDTGSAIAVGEGGATWMLEGGTWRHRPLPTPDAVASVWADRPDNVFAVGTRMPNGTSGFVARWNGMAWQTQTIAQPMNGLAGVAADGLIAVGVAGAALRFDGSAWSPLATGVTAGLNDVWAATATSAVAVGLQGTAVRYDGTAWTPAPSGTTDVLRGVWGSDATTYFALSTARILRYDGTRWSQLATPASPSWQAIWGAGSTEIYAVAADGSIHRYDGAGWALAHAGSPDAALRAIHGAGGRVFAVGSHGTLVVGERR